MNGKGGSDREARKKNRHLQRRKAISALAMDFHSAPPASSGRASRESEVIRQMRLAGNGEKRRRMKKKAQSEAVLLSTLHIPNQRTVSPIQDTLNKNPSTSEHSNTQRSKEDDSQSQHSACTRQPSHEHKLHKRTAAVIVLVTHLVGYATGSRNGAID